MVSKKSYNASFMHTIAASCSVFYFPTRSHPFSSKKAILLPLGLNLALNQLSAGHWTCVFTMNVLKAISSRLIIVCYNGNNRERCLCTQSGVRAHRVLNPLKAQLRKGSITEGLSPQSSGLWTEPFSDCTPRIVADVLKATGIIVYTGHAKLYSHPNCRERLTH